MSRLLWGQSGDRLYETGLDRGVLYLEDRSGVPWSGLTGIDEDMGGSSGEANYYDGLKYRSSAKLGDFSATLRAFTYPEEFLEYDGAGSIGNGLYVDDQSSKTFSLSYRTLVGDDIEGHDRGYKIHLVYNIVAEPTSSQHVTHSNSVDLQELSWKIAGRPEVVDGYRPTAHVFFDSRYLSPEKLQTIENTLYGDQDTNAYLPSLVDLFELMTLP